MFVTPAGPKAIHQYAHFRQDIDYLIFTSEILRTRFGLSFLGTHHSHHILDLKTLSGGDIKSTNVIARRNGYSRLCQIVLAFNQVKSNNTPHLFSYSGSKSLASEQDKQSEDARVSVNVSAISVKCFIYTNAKYAPPVHCPILILPGDSPIRDAMRSANENRHMIKDYSYPIDHIQFESIQPNSSQEQTENALPEEIGKMISHLPESVLADIEIRMFENTAVILMQIDKMKCSLAVAYETSTPISIKAISILIENKNYNIMEKLMNDGNIMDLGAIYSMARRLVDTQTMFFEKGDNKSDSTWFSSSV
jgi:hypothetical protein